MGADNKGGKYLQFILLNAGYVIKEKGGKTMSRMGIVFFQLLPAISLFLHQLPCPSPNNFLLNSSQVKPGAILSLHCPDQLELNWRLYLCPQGHYSGLQLFLWLFL